MLNVALTGNIASGKSTVARLFAEWGATVVDADAIVHHLERPGTPVFDAIVARFGPGIVAADGTLDRAALRQRVFAEPAARLELERMVHPAVAAERERLVREAEHRGDRIVVSDIPLLFEAGDPAGFDVVVLVDAPEVVRRERLRRGRELDPESAAAMMAAQLPSEAKRARSHFVIDNSGDLDALRRKTREVWRALTAMAAPRA